MKKTKITLITLMLLTTILYESIWMTMMRRQIYIFDPSFPLWRYFRIDYWYHVAMLGMVIIYGITLYHMSNGKFIKEEK